MENRLLHTDWYQLAMLQAYQQHGLEAEAVFEFFVRRLPAGRHFLVAAGLQQVIEDLMQMTISEAELAWLETTGHFQRSFIEQLASWRFTGDVHAMPEGSVFFAGEPILRVRAPLLQAQLIESRVINWLNFQSMIASKAARCRLAAPTKKLIDFGFRRAQSAEAGLLAARACFVAGFDGTATVSAGFDFGIPVVGTMAHAFVQAHDSELEAFRHFAATHPDNVVLLVDTFDLAQGVQAVIDLAREQAGSDTVIHGVRIDSGDLAAGAFQVRSRLNEAGLHDVKIFVSGDLDELRIQELETSGAPIDAYGVGTRLTTSSDAPYLHSVYKMQAYGGKLKRKLSAGKQTLLGIKQVVREFDTHGKMVCDHLMLEDETTAGEKLLLPVVKQGERCADQPSLEAIRATCQAGLASLPASLKSLETPCEPMRVELSPALLALQEGL